MDFFFNHYQSGYTLLQKHIEVALYQTLKPRVLFPEEVDTKMQMVAKPDESCEVVDALDSLCAQG